MSDTALLYAALGLLAALIVLATVVELRGHDDDDEFTPFVGVSLFTLAVGGFTAFVIPTLLTGVK